MNSRRRNGQAASCEPCRMHKVRCDHGMPVCGRCHKRNTASRCFYHPAPLTREGVRDSPISQSRTQRLSRSAKAQRSKRSQRPASPTPSSVEISIRSPETDPSLPPGYFGPTSFANAFSGSWSEDCDRQILAGGRSVLPSYWVPETTKIVSTLVEDPTIGTMVCDFSSDTQAAILPTLLVTNLMAELRSFINHDQSPQALHKLTTQMLESTAFRLRVPSVMRGREFHRLFSGDNMRLEIIGILYAIAGRASMFGYSNERFPGSASTASAARFKFARRMLTASDTAIQVCKILTPVNDLTTWLLYENWLLSSIFHGDASK